MHPPSDLLPLNQRSMFAFWRPYGLVPGGLLREASDYALILSGVPHPLFNGVHGAAPAGPDEARQMVAQIQAEANRAGLPLFWWMSPIPAENGLREALLAAGAVPVGACPAMRAEIAALNAPIVAGLEVREVDGEELALWAEIAALGTDLPPDVVAALREREPFIRPDGARRRYLGWLDGRPVATACTVEAHDVAGVFAIAILPEFRRRGIGAVLPIEPLRRSAERGHRVALLQASPMGFPVYQRLGFVTDGAYELFLMQPAG